MAPAGSSQPGSSGISAPPFISTFSTLANPVFSFPLSSSSTVVSMPSTSISSHVVGRDFVVDRSYAPILHKLVSKITGGSFVELADLLPDNSKMEDSESRTYFEGKLLVTPSKKRAVEITDIVTRVEAFSIYMLVLCSLHPSRWADLTQYKLSIIQTAKKFPGKAWLNYDSAFRKEAAASGQTDWAKVTPDLYNFHTRLPSSTAASSTATSVSYEPSDNPKRLTSALLYIV